MYESKAFAQIYQEDSRDRRQFESLQERWKRIDFERSFRKVTIFKGSESVWKIISVWI